MAALLDVLAGPASTLDEAAARQALVALNDELLEETQSFEEVELALTSAIDREGLVALLQRFFGHYIFQSFCVAFYERWQSKVGSEQADKALGGVKECINAAVQANLINRDLTAFDWRGQEGLALAEEIKRQTAAIFEVM
jgi:hypothetical protein